MNLPEFFKTVITSPEGWFNLSIGGFGTDWWEEWYKYPDQMDDIVRRIKTNRSRNVFFSAHLFSERTDSASAVLSSRTIQLDLDSTDVAYLPIKPTLLVQSSKGRHQGYWVIRDNTTPIELEIISQRLAYSIEGCNRDSWALNYLLRVPMTLNWKYPGEAQSVEIVELTNKHYTAAEFEILPGAAIRYEHAQPLEEWEFPEEGPNTLLKRYEQNMPTRFVGSYLVAQGDKTVYLWNLLCACFRAGMTRGEAFTVAKGSPNNRFIELKHNADEELAREVLRAEEAVLKRGENPRAIIADARNLIKDADAARRHISDIVRSFMRKDGSFWNSSTETLWYIPNDTGRPIRIHPRSEYMRMLLGVRFGINASEFDYSFMVEDLMAHTLAQPPRGDQKILSYYDADRGSILLHSGKKLIWRVTRQGIEVTPNGSDDIIFQWNMGEPFLFTQNPPQDPKWYDVVFGKSLDSLTLDFPRIEALALLRVWFLFVIIRSAAVSRPILTLIGQPGSGKSTLFRKVYALVYGKTKSLSSITNTDDFDQNTANNPIVVFDNVDTWERWLPDRLALASAASDVVKRKLYTDADTTVLKRDAVICLTAHSPKFGREDVADRMLILNFQRRLKFAPEGELIEEVCQYRNQFWGQIVQDLRAILETDPPKPEDIPQFRIEDFAKLGIWIARGIGQEQQFRAAISILRGEQSKFALEQESTLVDAILNLIEQYDDSIVPFTNATELLPMLIQASSDPRKFEARYSSAIGLSRKLFSLQEALRQICEIDFVVDKVRYTKKWGFRKKGVK